VHAAALASQRRARSALSFSARRLRRPKTIGMSHEQLVNQSVPFEFRSQVHCCPESALLAATPLIFSAECRASVRLWSGQPDEPLPPAGSMSVMTRPFVGAGRVIVKTPPLVSAM